MTLHLYQIPILLYSNGIYTHSAVFCVVVRTGFFFVFLLEAGRGGGGGGAWRLLWLTFARLTIIIISPGLCEAHKPKKTEPQRKHDECLVASCQKSK